MKTLTIVVPFFNEERTIAQLVSQIDQLPSGIVYHCIFVNDGSTDKSLDFLQAALKEGNFSHTIVNKVNEGKASAVREAVKLVTSTHVVILDADLELDTFDIPRLWEIVTSNKSEVVFGYRTFLAQSAFTYRYARGNQFISHFYGILFNEVITDIMCGYKLLPTKYLKQCPFKFSRFAIEIEIPLLLWLNRIRPFELYVDYKPRSREDGKVIGVKDALQVISNLLLFRVRSARKRTQ
jgi:glycosyltransferase involved in cell wall biosynthesis